MSHENADAEQDSAANRALVRFRMTSSNQENGFVGLTVVADSDEAASRIDSWPASTPRTWRTRDPDHVLEHSPSEGGCWGAISQCLHLRAGAQVGSSAALSV